MKNVPAAPGGSEHYSTQKKTMKKFTDPNAIERPFSLFADGFAWYSIDGSFKLFRQIAHVSAQISQLHLSHEPIVVANNGTYERDVY
jgi:hypothetical protein